MKFTLNTHFVLGVNFVLSARSWLWKHVQMLGEFAVYRLLSHMRSNAERPNSHQLAPIQIGPNSAGAMAAKTSVISPGFCFAQLLANSKTRSRLTIDVNIAPQLGPSYTLVK